MWWKIYFWIYTILTVPGIIFIYGKLSEWLLVDALEVGTSIAAILALYSYVYKKKIFSRSVWQIFFWVSVASSTIEILYKYTAFNFLSSLLESRMVTSGQEILLGIALSLPIYYAAYQLAYKKASSVKKRK